MYINDLGLGRINSAAGMNRVTSINGKARTASVNNRNNTARTVSAARGKNTDSYASVMQKAIENQKATGIPTFATAGDIIIQEAFKKMETDPEWKESVMNKVKEYYTGDYTASSNQKSYSDLLGQNSLQNYFMQSLISGQSSLGMGLTGYSPYGISNLAASAYGNVMNSALSSSLFGSWQL